MEHNHHMMHHDESGHLPKGIKEATEAKYPVGTRVKLLTDHMSDMLDAEAVVVGVYDTTVYSVTYNDTESGELVEDHKWVVDGEVSYEGSVGIGDEVTIQATHMAGMNGAKGQIVRVTHEPVYMVDYYSSDHKRWVKNHQWVVESEVTLWEE
uniref:DUF1541 domain-containing protein n=1 Tax=Candidatus Enterococcus willemsii TaxID=1857215 RepID=UPI00403F16CB